MKNTAAQAHQQKTITTSFSPITPHATSQSTATQMGSQPGNYKGVTIDGTIAIFHARRPGLVDHHRQINPLSPAITGAYLPMEISLFWIDLC